MIVYILIFRHEKLTRTLEGGSAPSKRASDPSTSGDQQQQPAKRSKFSDVPILRISQQQKVQNAESNSNSGSVVNSVVPNLPPSVTSTSTTSAPVYQSSAHQA